MSISLCLLLDSNLKDHSYVSSTGVTKKQDYIFKLYKKFSLPLLRTVNTFYYVVVIFLKQINIKR